MYGMSLLHNYDRYDEKSFTDRTENIRLDIIFVSNV